MVVTGSWQLPLGLCSSWRGALCWAVPWPHSKKYDSSQCRGDVTFFFSFSAVVKSEKLAKAIEAVSGYTVHIPILRVSLIKSDILDGATCEEC